MMQKRGVFFSTDALIALAIILLTVLIIYPVAKHSKRESEIQADMIEVLSSLKIGEVDNTYVQDLITQGKIKDLNKTILEQIGEFYVTNLTLARRVAEAVLSSLDTDENIGLWYGKELLYSKNTTSFETAKNIDTERQTISGVRDPSIAGEEATGFSARAYLASSLQKKYFYFGGYVGDGNASLKIDYNGTLNEVAIEIAVNKDFDIYINDQFSGHYQQSPSEFEPAKYDLGAYIANFDTGENILKFVADEGNLYIAGGFTKITYEDSAVYGPAKYYFPGIEGLINLYDGFYVPGTLNTLDVFLHLNSNFTTFLIIGNITVFNRSTDGEETITITNSELSSLLNYQKLSEKTIPLRLGLENVSYVTNITKEADVFSVTDLSGSMGGSKISDAKDANNVLIDAILNFSGNRVGLVGYRTQAYDSDFHELSDDKISLANEIESWYASGATCICCGINKAISKFFSEPSSFEQLIAYYNFDDNVLDQVGDNDGTISGSSSYVSGVSNNALELYGNAHVEIPDIITSKKGSISVWIKPNEMKSQTIFDASTSKKYFFIDIDSGGDLRFWLEDSSDADFQDAKYDVSSLPVEEWHHIVAVWRYGESPSTQLYLDGNLVDFDNDVADTIANFLSPYIGETRSNYITGWDFEGIIDELRIYNKVLTLEEIQGLNDRTPMCGNNIVEVGEVCDGETRICKSGEYYGTQDCNVECNGFDTCDTIGICGDGLVNNGEECDDGNTEDKDGCSSTCQIEERYRSIIVMSDGHANYECTPHQYNWGQAKQDAIQAACDAFNNYGIVVHAVGFGSNADENTLQAIANCGNGSYYYGDVGDLVSIYQQIASEIIEATYKEQTLKVTGNLSTVLYPDSYIKFNYSAQAIPHGLITTIERQFIDEYHGSFSIPSNSNVIEVRAISYSGPRWTNEVKINNIPIYELSEYGGDYIKLGDPYSINIPTSFVLENNIVNITTAVSPNVPIEGSRYNKIIYTIIKNTSAYSPILPSARGCVWDIEFEDNSHLTFAVPSAYSGTSECYYNSTDRIHDSNDAIQVAVHNLLELLDLDLNGKVDIKFIEQDLEIISSEIAGIPYLYSVEVQVRRWD